MDRGFMEHYFDVIFNDAIGEIAGNDERYAELQSVADEAVHTLAGIVGKSNTALFHFTLFLKLNFVFHIVP